MNTVNVDSPEMSASGPIATKGSFDLPLIPIAITASLLAIALAVVLHFFFPLFKLSEELLAPMPPEEIAQKREATYQLYRLLDPMVGMSSFAILAAIALPLVLKASGKTTKGNAALLIPMALLAGVLTCVGLALGHLVLELEAAKSLGIGRTFLARWLEFAFLGGGIGAAVGAAVGGSTMAMRVGVNSAIVGVVCALVLDIIFVPLTTAKVDMLVPGGIINQSAKDPQSLGLFMLAVVVTITLGCAKELSKPK